MSRSSAQTRPGEPWRMGGSALVIPVTFSREASYSLSSEGLDVMLIPALSRVPGLIIAARFDKTSTLSYHEIAVGVFARPDGGKPAFYCSQLWVDSSESLESGERLWSLEKKLATIEWDEKPGTIDVTVSGDQGAILQLSGKKPGPGVSIPARLPCLSLLPSGKPLLWSVRSRSVVNRSRILVQTPAASPLADLKLAGNRTAMVLDPLHLRISVPRR